MVKMVAESLNEYTKLNSQEELNEGIREKYYPIIIKLAKTSEDDFNDTLIQENKELIGKVINEFVALHNADINIKIKKKLLSELGEKNKVHILDFLKVYADKIENKKTGQPTYNWNSKEHRFNPRLANIGKAIV